MPRAAMLAPSLLLLLVACGDAATSDAPVLADTEAYLDREVLVGMDDDPDGVARMRVQEEYGLRELDRIAALGVVRLSIEDERQVKEVAALLEDDASVRYAEPNYLARATSTTSPDDPYLGYQWNLDQVDAKGAWAYGTGGGVIVAVLDTGVRSGGPDGIANLLSGYDFYNNDSNPSDGDGHGTFVAGTIGQRTDNGVGVAGLAPGVAILPLKVMSDDGYGDINSIANGLVWAADQGARVANMSLGSSSYSSTLKSACDYAHDRGVTLVAASGNEYASQVGYPAAFDNVIAVGASRYDGTRAGYSNTGAGLDLLAPGGDTAVDQNGDGYADGVLQETIQGGGWTYTFWEGTSMAAPHVAAAAALVIAQGVDDPDQVRSVLRSTAQDVGASGYDTSTGYGVLDVGAAVALAAGSGSSGGDTGGSSGGDTGGSSGGDTGGEDDGGAGGEDDGGGADTTAPVISSVSGYTQGTRFTIEWVTNEPADSYVDFEDYGMYGDDSLTTSHSLSFTGSRGSTYTFDIYSTDAAGNASVDGTWMIRL